MAQIMTTSGAVIVKAGAGINETIKENNPALDQFIAEAESWINVATRYNWSDGYAALNTDVKHLLNEAASNLAACYVIIYDMSGYTSRTEAEIMINLLLNRTNEILKVLKDKKAETFISGA